MNDADKKILKEAVTKNGDSADSQGYVPGKGQVFALIAICAIGVAAVGFIAWYVTTIGLSAIHPLLPYILGAVIVIIVGFVFIGAIVIALSTASKGGGYRPSPIFRGLLIKFFLPLMVVVGSIFKVKKIRIERVFIDLNNAMVRSLAVSGKKFRPDRIAILMPHCIQYDDCRIKVTKDVMNCVSCGKCEIAELITISKKYDLKLFVLTGGTVARRKLKELRPDAAIAVACERDLTSGVQDAYPLPVLAVINKRPNGYCLQTGVDMDDVKAAIIDILGVEEPSTVEAA